MRLASVSIPQGRGRPDSGSGRIVQLVSQPGRKRAEGEQPFPLSDGLLHVLDAEEQPFEHVQRHGEPLAHHRCELLRVQDEEPRGYDGAHRVVVNLRHPVTEIGLPGAGVDADLVGAVRLYVVTANEPRKRHLTLE
jgi:hypothetical protein